MPERIVHCRLLKKDLPGLERPPFRNELGQRLFAEVSKEGWQKWVKDSVRLINTYKVDLVTPEGQKFMLKQCAIYFGYEEGDAAQTAWTPPADLSDAHSHEHGHDHSHTHADPHSGKAGE